MATILATCPSCGDVEFPHNTAAVVETTTENRSATRVAVVYTCPSCVEHRHTVVDITVLGVLRRAGMRHRVAVAPDEVFDPARRSSAELDLLPALTELEQASTPHDLFS